MVQSGLLGARRSFHRVAAFPSAVAFAGSIGKLAGINVLFDPDYTARRIKIELNGVTLPEALEIASLRRLLKRLKVADSADEAA